MKDNKKQPKTIPDYATADTLTRAKIDEIIRKFEAAGPEDFNIIQDFGQQQLDAVKKGALSQIEMAGLLSSAVNGKVAEDASKAIGSDSANEFRRVGADIRALNKKLEAFVSVSVDAADQLGIVIAAAREIQRRYKELYVPECKDELQKNPTLVTKYLLDETLEGEKDFKARIKVLDSGYENITQLLLIAQALLETGTEWRKQVSAMRAKPRPPKP